MKRERALYEGQPVTVIERGRRQSTIRTGLGFTVKVRTKDLKEMDKLDDRKEFTVRT